MNKSKQIMETTSLIDYLIVSDQYYKKELVRKDTLLTWDIGNQVLQQFRNEMLIKPLPMLLEKEDGFNNFFLHSQYDNLSLVYSLYKDENDCLKPLRNQMKLFIYNTGRDHLKSVELHNAEGKPYNLKEVL